MTLVWIEDAGDELGQQAVAFARELDGDAHVLTIEGTAYAPAAWARAIVDQIGAHRTVLAAGTERGNEVMAHVAAILDQPMAANCVSVGPGGEVTRVRWGGSLLEEAKVHGEPLLLTVAPHAVAAAPSDAHAR